jgi:hypothetical protein
VKKRPPKEDERPDWAKAGLAFHLPAANGRGICTPFQGRTREKGARNNKAQIAGKQKRSEVVSSVMHDQKLKRFVFLTLNKTFHPESL